jgi:hypothetical protein
MDTKSPFEIWDFEGYARQQLRRYTALASLADAATDADKTAAGTWRDILDRIERDDAPGAFGVAYVGFGATDPFVLLLRAAQVGDHESGMWDVRCGINSRGIHIAAKTTAATRPESAGETIEVRAVDGCAWRAEQGALAVVLGDGSDILDVATALGCRLGTFTLAELADRARDIAGSTYADHSIALNQIHARLFGLDVPTEPMPVGTAAADETVRRLGIILAALDAASHALALARTASGMAEPVAKRPTPPKHDGAAPRAFRALRVLHHLLLLARNPEACLIDAELPDDIEPEDAMVEVFGAMRKPVTMQIDMPPVDADRVAAMVEKILQNKVVSDATGGRDLAVVLVGQHEKGAAWLAGPAAATRGGVVVDADPTRHPRDEGLDAGAGSARLGSRRQDLPAGHRG